MTLVVTPSKFNMLRDAKPLHEIRFHPQIRRLVVDRALLKYWYRDVRTGVIEWKGQTEWREDGVLAVIALDDHNYFIATYRGEDWPHAHPCPKCGTLVRCECAFGELDFDDCLAQCPKCRAK